MSTKPHKTPVKAPEHITSFNGIEIKVDPDLPKGVMVVKHAIGLASVPLPVSSAITDCLDYMIQSSTVEGSEISYFKLSPSDKAKLESELSAYAMAGKPKKKKAKKKKKGK